MSVQPTVEAGKAAATKTACSAQEIVKDTLRIWYLFESVHARKVQGNPSIGIARCMSQSAFVDE